MFVTIAFVALAVGLFYRFLISNFNYWTKRGVIGPKPKPITGNYPNALSQKRHIGYDIDEIYRAFRHDEDFVGIFNNRSPQLLITSPTLVHKIYVDYFKNFHDNEMSTMVNKESDFVFGNNPFILTGEEWKEKRSLLSPGFTMSRIKATYDVTNKVCRQTCEFIERQNKMSSKNGIDARNLSLRFTSEIVTDCVLGIEAASFTEKPAPIIAMIKRLFEPTPKMIIYFILVGFIPTVKKYLKIRFMPKDLETFFADVVQTAIDLRKSNPNQKERADFLNYMLQMQHKKDLRTKDIAANTMTFLFDGFETSAGVLSHILLLLGRNPEAQERLYDEVMANSNENGSIEFETLYDLPYLDACIHEALRIFPPGFFVNKLCTEPIVLTSKTGRSVQLQKGDVAILPLYSIMIDEDLYPNPLEFKPDRFLESSVKELRDKGIYYGFGDGPRTCLGMRFALAQLKAVTAELVRNFKIRVNPKTRKDNIVDAKQFFACLDGGVWLDFEARN